MDEMNSDALDEAVDNEVDDMNSARRLDADSILDSLVPQTIDWRETVRRHPFGSVACVGLVVNDRRRSVADVRRLGTSPPVVAHRIG